MFNYAAEPELEDVRVRKALAHVLDGDQIGRVARGEAYTGVEYYAGLVDLHAEQIMSADEPADFEHYGHDLDKAEVLLEEAGWTKEEGTWYPPDGSEAEFEVIGVAVRHWGNPEQPDYWGAFQMNFLTENAGTEDAPGQSFDLDVDSPSQGKVNLEELVHTAQQATSEEEQHEALKMMMIVFNELLPRIPLWTYTYLSPAIDGVRVESFDPDHPASQNEQYQDNHIMLQLIQGDLKSV